MLDSKSTCRAFVVDVMGVDIDINTQSTPQEAPLTAGTVTVQPGIQG